MRAAVYTRKGPAAEVLRIEERPIPEPGPGELRVKLAFSGVNPSDVKSRAGTSSRAAAYAEVIPHSDGAGIVDTAGPGAPAALVGRRVWVYNAQWERAFGTAAEYVTLPARQVVPLPDRVALEEGAAIGIPLMTAFHGIEACGTLLGRTVLVPGAAGSVGYYATQLARLAGARVIALVSSDAKAAIARRAGATDTIDYRSEDTGTRVRELTAGRGADFIVEVDAAGNAPRYGELLAHGGKAIVYGSNAPQVTVPFGPMILGFVSLYFYIVYRLPPEVMQRTVSGIGQLLEAGALTHPELAVYPLEDVVAAHERVERGANAKVLLRL